MTHTAPKHLRQAPVLMHRVCWDLACAYGGVHLLAAGLSPWQEAEGLHGAGDCTNRAFLTATPGCEGGQLQLRTRNTLPPHHANAYGAPPAGTMVQLAENGPPDALQWGIQTEQGKTKTRTQIAQAHAMREAGRLAGGRSRKHKPLELHQSGLPHPHQTSQTPGVETRTRHGHTKPRRAADFFQLAEVESLTCLPRSCGSNILQRTPRAPGHMPPTGWTAHRTLRSPPCSSRALNFSTLPTSYACPASVRKLFFAATLLSFPVLSCHAQQRQMNWERTAATQSDSKLETHAMPRSGKFTCGVQSACRDCQA